MRGGLPFAGAVATRRSAGDEWKLSSTIVGGKCGRLAQHEGICLGRWRCGEEKGPGMAHRADRKAMPKAR